MKKLVLSLIVVLLFISCTSTVNLKSTEFKLQDGDYNAAFDDYVAKSKVVKAQQGDIVLNLDLGMLAHYDSKYSESNTLLTRAEDSITENFTQSVTAKIGTFLVNDNTAAYRGEDYEDIYINIFKSLNYYHLGKIESSMVELRRMSEKQTKLEVKYNIQTDKILSSSSSASSYLKGYRGQYFTNSALAQYLTMIFSRNLKDINTFNLSKQYFANSYVALSDYYTSGQTLSLAEEVYEYPSLMARVNFLAFNGLIPTKYERFDAIPYFDTYIRIAYPVLGEYRTSVSKIVVKVAENTLQLNLVESIGDIAKSVFRANQSVSINKSIVRSITKNLTTDITSGIVKEVGKNSSDQSTSSFLDALSSIVKVFGRTASAASESADVRCAHFLPSCAWAGGITLAEGNYDITVDYYNKFGKLLFTKTFPNFEVKNNQVNLVETYCLL